MTFKALQTIFEKIFGGTYLSDIAKELEVTPQVVSNWKSRDKVPYKYVQILRKKIDDLNNTTSPNTFNPLTNLISDKDNNVSDSLDISKLIKFSYIALTKHIKLLIFTPLFVCIIVSFYVVFFVGSIYNSYATILPSANKNSNQLNSFVAQFGANSGNKGVSDFSSAELYPDFIKSNYVLGNLLKIQFNTLKNDSALSLLKILTNRELNKKGEVNDTSLFYGRAKLNKIIKVISSRRSPLVRISVNANEPKLARDITLAVIDQLDLLQNRFKLDRIKEKRIFVENRIDKIDIDLKNKEENLKIFREKNRNINSSPALLLEQSRLQRDSEVLTQLYITLKNEYERMQIEEVENSRMFVVLDNPTTPLKRSSPKRKQIIITVFSSMLIITILFILSIEWIIQNWDSKLKKLFY